jgi:DNA-binding SARP family transcriptional activator
VAFSPTTTRGDLWHVNADGTLLPAHEQHRRLCVLDPQTACDLLQFISQAHGLAPANTAPVSPHDQQRHHPPNDPAAGMAGEATGTAVPPARLRVLGDCRLTIHHQHVPIGRSAAWQTLVLLAARPDGATARQIIETVWPGLPPASITNRLYTTLSDLRTQLRPILESPLIVHHRDRYLLDPAVVDVDLWHQQAAAHTASQAITTTSRRHAHRNLIAQRGELASGHTWPWLAPLRETIREHLIDAYVELADELPPTAAIELLHDAIAVDPYNEDVHRRTIAALIDIGDHTAAARLYDTYTQLLGNAGLRPSTELTDLAARITTKKTSDTDTPRRSR